MKGSGYEQLAELLPSSHTECSLAMVTITSEYAPGSSPLGRLTGLTIVMVNQNEFNDLSDFWLFMRQVIMRGELASKDAGLTGLWFYVLLAIASFGPHSPPTIGELAKHLLVTHHDAVMLSKRMENHGLIRREKRVSNLRKIFLTITPKGIDLAI